jgi:hypothetical protein
MQDRDTVKGLDVAKAFFFEWGLPELEKQFPALSLRIAAGKLLGSDVLGADDAISRDHNWGPQFWLFLNDTDYTLFGQPLVEQLNNAAPNPWKGYRLDGAGDKAVEVFSITRFMKDFLSLDAPPQNTRDWVSVDKPTPKALPGESNLYFLRHGAIFRDPLGELSAWRESLHFYPRDIWRRRLAEETFRIWHHGEYNFVQRMTHRRDPLALQICLGEFTTGVMRLWLLLAADYTPYWKWLAHEFRKLPDAALVEPLLMRLAAAPDVEEQSGLVKDICRIAHERLLTGGWVTGKGVSPHAQYLSPLLNDYEELTWQIEDSFWKP